MLFKALITSVTKKYRNTTNNQIKLTNLQYVSEILEAKNPAVVEKNHQTSTVEKSRD